jgi:hypothetical protein
MSDHSPAPTAPAAIPPRRGDRENVGPAAGDSGQLDLTRPYRPITDLDRSRLRDLNEYLITEVAPAFFPMRALVTLHTGEKYPASDTTVVATAEHYCRQVIPVVLRLRTLPSGGGKIVGIQKA